MTYRQLLARGKACLEQAGITDAAVDSWELLEHVSGLDRNAYYMHMEDGVAEDQCSAYDRCIEKRASHIPLQQLTGKAYFMGLTFSVNEHVLIPRFDTENLVEQVIRVTKPGMHILDMCTGSGCILLSVLHECPETTGTGVDISKEALQIAQRNAENLGISAEFVKSDLFHNITEEYDIIISNPPYIPTAIIHGLDEEVKDHEPMLALDGREDGLHFYRRIIKEGWEHLHHGGWLCFEIGYDQGQAVSSLMEEAGYINIQVKKDLAGLDRIVIGGKPCLTD
ncbi:MAG: peptide chain release factor N(5)-glutamine methyltransferase [Lachnospiraceae bacterium]|nr:peptide chain release factor N(5)-glutamine methyltransferase [Lachnospiraceae bacterium]